MTTNRHKLNQAIRLITEAKADLNREKSACGHCGLTVRANWTEDQAGETLVGVIKRIDRLLTQVVDLQPWLDAPLTETAPASKGEPARGTPSRSLGGVSPA
jgi:hypothetical protein